MALVGLCVFLGLGLAASFGAVLLPLFKRLQFKQIAYEDAPQTHQKKTGTPTMGGIVFVIALGAIAFLSVDRYLALPLLGLVALCGLVGFIDDILSITRGRNRGLRARTKLLATALVAIMFLRVISDSTEIFPRDVIFHAGTFVLTAPHWLWLLLGIVAVTGSIHAVNLTDGLDGLATGTMIPPLVAFAAIAYAAGQTVPVVAASLGVGACVGFLIFNRYPAKMFMGDTGSLALGGLLSGIAILEGQMLLLILVGGVFVAEALSVMLQVTYFKLTGGKRIFRMSPLHHHFELGGLKETQVTWRFWAASAVLSLLGWVIAK